MENFTVKDLMVPLTEYATVLEGSTLFEAVAALEKAQEEFDHTKYRHRGVLIMNKKGKVNTHRRVQRTEGCCVESGHHARQHAIEALGRLRRVPVHIHGTTSSADDRLGGQ